MAKLNVSGRFIVTIGYGAGPVIWVEVCVSDQAGKSVQLTFPKDPNDGPVKLFVLLSALLGPGQFALKITDLVWQDNGFYAFLVQAPGDVGNLNHIGVTTLGILVSEGADNGQALACSCSPAAPAMWTAARTEATGELKEKLSKGSLSRK